MAGASKIVKRLQKKGIDLADFRLANNKTDIIDFELLVGADYYYEIVNPFRLPIRHFGMWLKFDRFGRNFLFGQIPGSKDIKKQQNINYVSIHNINSSNVNNALNKCDVLDLENCSNQLDKEEIVDTIKPFVNNDSSILGIPQIIKAPSTQEDVNIIVLDLAMAKDANILLKDPNLINQHETVSDNIVIGDPLKRIPSTAFTQCEQINVPSEFNAFVGTSNKLDDQISLNHNRYHFSDLNQKSWTVIGRGLSYRVKSCLSNISSIGHKLFPQVISIFIGLMLFCLGKFFKGKSYLSRIKSKGHFSFSHILSFLLIFNILCFGTNFDSDNKCLIRANTSLMNGPKSIFNQMYPNILPATSKCTYLNFAHLSNKSFKYYLSSWKHFSTLLIYQSFFDFDLRGKVSTRSKLRNSLLNPIYIVIRSVLYYYSFNLRLLYKYPDLLDIIIQVFHPWFTWPLIWIFRLTELDSTCCYILQDIYGNMNKVYLMLSIWNLGFLAAIQKSFEACVLSFANSCIRSRSIGGVPGEIISDKGCSLKACNYELIYLTGI